MQHMPAKNRKRLILDTLKKKGGKDNRACRRFEKIADDNQP